MSQAFEDPRQGARMEVEDLGEQAGGNLGIAADDADDESLRPRHSERSRHALGGPLQPVIDGPKEPHELQHLAERAPNRRLVFDADGGTRGPPVRDAHLPIQAQYRLSTNYIVPSLENAEFSEARAERRLSSLNRKRLPFVFGIGALRRCAQGREEKSP